MFALFLGSLLMKSARAQSLLSCALWLPVLWTLSSPVCCSRGPPAWRFTYSEVVIPKKVSLSSSSEQLAYRVHFRGQRHVIRMKLKRNMLPRHFPVFTDNDQGAMQEDYPFVPQDCYYYSYLEGVPGSVATLDTCYGGLRGMLQVDDFTYEIKPLETSSKFEHVISLLVSEDRDKESERCTIQEEANQLLEETKLAETPRAGTPYFWRLHIKHLRLFYAASHSLYVKESNITRLVEMVVTMNSIVHTIFKPVGLNVFIRVIIVWNDRDKVSMTANAGRVTELFGLHKQHNVLSHAAGVLLTGHTIGHSKYFAFHKGICNPNWGSLYVTLETMHLFWSAAVFAHAMCHDFGNQHDTSGCVCFRRTNCVMHPVPGLFDMLSNCSYSSINEVLHGWDDCLSYLNVPYDNYPYIARRCGDGILDPDEKCDCGSFKQCALDKCCGTDCQLTEGSLCTKGGCCNRCRYSPPGVICRDKLGICDLREYCNGLSGECPQDMYIQDGTPCSAVAVCMKGNCSDRNMQCKALFGFRARDGSPACYKDMNVRGDPAGNCGVKIQRGGSKPLRCEDDNVFCGLLQCDRVETVPGGGEHTSFHHIIVKQLKEVHCYGYDAHHGTELPEMGLVVDGATCGPGKFCKKQNCTFYQDLGFSCDVQKCNFRGVCNNNNKCHCVRGWKPPTCEERGLGGSEDSGPPPGKDLGLRANIITSVNEILLVALARSAAFMGSLLCGGLLKVKIVIENVLFGGDS